MARKQQGGRETLQSETLSVGQGAKSLRRGVVKVECHKAVHDKHAVRRVALEQVHKLGEALRERVVLGFQQRAVRLVGAVRRQGHDVERLAQEEERIRHAHRAPTR